MRRNKLIAKAAAIVMSAIMFVSSSTFTINAAELEKTVSEDNYEMEIDSYSEDNEISEIDSGNEKKPDPARKVGDHLWKIPLKVDYSKKNQRKFTLKFYPDRLNNEYAKELYTYFSAPTYNGEYTYETSWRATYVDNYWKKHKFIEEEYYFYESNGIEDGILTVNGYTENTKNIEFDCELLSQAFEIEYPDGQIVHPTTWEKLDEESGHYEPIGETGEENTLKTYLNATEPIEVEPGYWILPVDFTDVMMHIFYRVAVDHNSALDNGQKADWIGIRYADFEYKYSKLSGSIVPPDVTYGDSGVIRLAYVREKIRDSLDWKRAQVIVHYTKDSYNGKKPVLEAFQVHDIGAKPLLGDLEESNGYSDPVYPAGETTYDKPYINFTKLIRNMNHPIPANNQ